MNWFRQTLIIWMVATIGHAPFPVWDGDNLTSGEIASIHLAVLDHSFDLDFILLGCDLPDDYDDGPLDDDPEQGASFVFGAPFAAQSNLTLSNLARLSSQFVPTAPGSLCFLSQDREVSPAIRLAEPLSCLPFQNFSFGKLSQSGIAHFHC
jgi:hypothetical protein